jgi:hypothetical protein
VGVAPGGEGKKKNLIDSVSGLVTKQGFGSVPQIPRIGGRPKAPNLEGGRVPNQTANEPEIPEVEARPKAPPLEGGKVPAVGRDVEKWGFNPAEQRNRIGAWTIGKDGTHHMKTPNGHAYSVVPHSHAGTTHASHTSAGHSHAAGHGHGAGHVAVFHTPKGGKKTLIGHRNTVQQGKKLATRHALGHGPKHPTMRGVNVHKDETVEKYSEDQARASDGKWTSGGDSGASQPETRGGFAVRPGMDDDDEPQGVGTKPERSALPSGRHHDYMPGAFQESVKAKKPIDPVPGTKPAEQGDYHGGTVGDPGVMVALMMPPHVGKELLAKFGGNGPGKIGDEKPGDMNAGDSTIPLHFEPVENLHCTLAYLGKRSELPPDALGHIADTVHTAIRGHGPIVGRIGGHGKFFADSTSDKREVHHVTIDAPALPEFRQRIMNALQEAGLPVRQDHGFVPHVTLASSDPNNPAGTIKPPDFGGGVGGVLVFNAVSIVSGKHRIDVPLKMTRKFMDGLSDVGGGALLPNPKRAATSAPPRATTGEAAEAALRGNRADVYASLEVPRPGLALGYGKALTAEQETELIRHNAQEPEARAPHRFKAAQWTHPNGHPRCKVCGNEERAGGMCRPDLEKSEFQTKADMPHETRPGLLTRTGQRNCAVCGRFTPVKGLCLPHFSPGAHVPKVNPRVDATGGQGAIDIPGSVPGAGIPHNVPDAAQTDARGFVVNQDTGVTPQGIAQPREPQGAQRDNRARFDGVVTPSPGPPPEEQEAKRSTRKKRKSLGRFVDKSLRVGDATDREEVRAILERRRNEDEDSPIDYRAIVKADEQRYTLGVAYPANEVDAHKEFTDPIELEQAAWSAMARQMGIGIQHMDGTDGAGVVVESYIYRGPSWEMDGQTVKPGDWLLGVVWTPTAWQLIRSGQLTGYSIQGYAQTKKV